MTTTPPTLSPLIVVPVQHGSIPGSIHTLMINDTATGQNYIATRGDMGSLSCPPRQVSPMWRAQPLGPMGCGGSSGINGTSGSAPGGIGDAGDGSGKKTDPDAPQWIVEGRRVAHEGSEWENAMALANILFCVDDAGTSWRIFLDPDNMEKPLRALGQDEAREFIIAFHERLMKDSAPITYQETHAFLQDIFLQPLDQLPARQNGRDITKLTWIVTPETKRTLYIENHGWQGNSLHNLDELVEAAAAMPLPFVHMLSSIHLIDHGRAKGTLTFVDEKGNRPTPRDEWTYDGSIELRGVPTPFDPYRDFIRAASQALFSDSMGVHHQLWMIARLADGVRLTGRSGQRSFAKGIGADVVNMLREGETGEVRMDWVKENPHTAMLIATLLSHPTSEPYAGFDLHGPAATIAAKID